MDKAVRVCDTVFIAHESIPNDAVVRERGIRCEGSGKENIVILHRSETYCNLRAYWWSVHQAFYPKDTHSIRMKEIKVISGQRLLVGVDLYAPGKRTMKHTQAAALLMGGKAEVTICGHFTKYTKVTVFLPLGQDITLLKKAFDADTKRGKRPPLECKLLALRG